MTNPPKAKGTAFESAVVKYAKANGFLDARRIALAGKLDRGDIDLCGDMSVILECKAYATYSDAQVMLWLGETERERVNAGARAGFLVVKRARKPIDHAWFVRTDPFYQRPVFRYLGDALRELRRQGYGEPLR